MSPVDGLTWPALHQRAELQATSVLEVHDLGPWQATPPFSPAGDASGARHAAPRRVPARRIVISLFALLVLVAVAAGLLFSNSSALPASSSNGTGPPVAPAISATPVAVRVVASDYVGRPVGDVAAQVAAMGLSVQLRELTTTAAPPGGTVVSVDPAGDLSPGVTVTITYSAVSSATDRAPSESPSQSTSPASSVTQG